jgi:predicted MFS family arabinose efflux permease
MSGTSKRVGEHFAANTIGLQMAATGLGTAVIPSLVGTLAKRASLEVVPVCMAVVFASLFGLYLLAARSSAKA